MSKNVQLILIMAFVKIYYIFLFGGGFFLIGACFYDII